MVGELAVTSGVPQGSILGRTLFDVFLNDLEGGIKSALTKFANETKPSGEVATLAGRATLQDHLDRLEAWANVMEFNQDKWKVLCLAEHNPGA